MRVQACNDVGCGGWSNSDAPTTFGPPPAPTGFVGNGGDLWVEWNWNSVPVTGPNQRFEGGFWDGRILNPVNSQSTAYGTWTSTSFRATNPAIVIPNQMTNLTLRVCNDLGCSSDVSANAMPTVNPSVTAVKGANAQGLPGCSHSSCRWIDVSGRGFTPFTTYTVQCIRVSNGTVFHTGGQTTNSVGEFGDATTCYFGFPGEQVRVTAGGVSTTITW